MTMKTKLSVLILLLPLLCFGQPILRNYYTTNSDSVLMTPVVLIPTLTTNVVSGTNVLTVSGTFDELDDGQYVWDGGGWTRSETGISIWDDSFWALYGIGGDYYSVLEAAVSKPWTTAWTDSISVVTNQPTTNVSALVAWNFSAASLQTVSTLGRSNVLVQLGAAQAGSSSTLLVVCSNTTAIVFTNQLAWLNGMGRTNVVSTNTYFCAQSWSTNHADTAMAVKSQL